MDHQKESEDGDYNINNDIECISVREFRTSCDDDCSGSGNRCGKEKDDDVFEQEEQQSSSIKKDNNKVKKKKKNIYDKILTYYDDDNDNDEFQDEYHHHRHRRRFDGVKRGSIFCCGYCCDMRRAVIIVNILNIVISIMMGVLVVILYMLYYKLMDRIHHNDIAQNNMNITNVDGGYGDFYDDDFVQDAMDHGVDIDLLLNLNADAIFVASMLYLLGCCLLSIVGMCGAITYNVIMIMMSSIIYMIQASFSLITVNLIGLAYCVLFAYPHLVLIHEIRMGIMKYDTYRINEEYSCCCV